MTVTMEKKICLESRYLDHNIRDHLLSKLQQTLSTDCTKDIGHIIGVTKLVNILHHEIDRANGANVFTVSFEAETLKPDPGTTLSGTVCMIYKDGVFIDVLVGRQKMLIPKIYLKTYTFDETVPCYTNDEGKSINMGDILMANVTASQYNNKTFSCFGSIV